MAREARPRRLRLAVDSPPPGWTLQTRTDDDGTTLEGHHRLPDGGAITIALRGLQPLRSEATVEFSPAGVESVDAAMHACYALFAAIADDSRPPRFPRGFRDT